MRSTNLAGRELHVAVLQFPEDVALQASLDDL
jgi:hypothetical protein